MSVFRIRIRTARIRILIFKKAARIWTVPEGLAKLNKLKKYGTGTTFRFTYIHYYLVNST